MRSSCVIVIALGILSLMWAAACGDVSEEVESAYTRGAAMLQTGDLSTALPLLEKVEQSTPDYKSVRSYLVTAYKFIGVEYYVNNRLDEAVAAWQKALRYSPDNQEIKNYIARSKSESKAINKLNGFPDTPVLETAKPDTIPSKPAHHTIAAASTTPVVPVVTPASQISPRHELPAVVKAGAASFGSGLAVGPAFSSGGTDAGRVPRWLFSGNLSLSSRVSPWGGRVEFLYGQSTESVDVDTTAGSEQFTSLFGAGVSVVNRIMSRPRQSIRIMAGIGLYEAVRHRYSQPAMEGGFHKETKAGYSFGSEWRHRLGGFDSSINIRYLILNSSLVSNALQLTFGFGLP